MNTGLAHHYPAAAASAAAAAAAGIDGPHASAADSMPSSSGERCLIIYTTLAHGHRQPSNWSLYRYMLLHYSRSDSQIPLLSIDDP